MDRKEIIEILESEIIDSIEARELLGCSRQYINELVTKEKLVPIKKSKSYTLFLKSDVLEFKK